MSAPQTTLRGVKIGPFYYAPRLLLVVFVTISKQKQIFRSVVALWAVEASRDSVLHNGVC